MNHVVIASPVRQVPAVLARCLSSLVALDHAGCGVSYAFVDDNDDPESTRLLLDHAGARPTAMFEGKHLPAPPLRRCHDHLWTEQLIWAVAGYKDALIEHALDVRADAILFVDSDLVVHPQTLRALVDAEREIVSEVFWTSWKPGTPQLPQVWASGQYQLYRSSRGEDVSADEAARRTEAFLELLRTPGVHEVGGLGALTLIRRKALLAGCRFAEIPTLPLWGEDRHFCVRAQALGFRLWADTHAPAMHLYR